jgi:hypothetical protein
VIELLLLVPVMWLNVGLYVVTLYSPRRMLGVGWVVALCYELWWISHFPSSPPPEVSLVVCVFAFIALQGVVAMGLLVRRLPLATFVSLVLLPIPLSFLMGLPWAARPSVWSLVTLAGSVYPIMMRKRFLAQW